MTNKIKAYTQKITNKYITQRKWSFWFFVYFLLVAFVIVAIFFVKINDSQKNYKDAQNIKEKISILYSGDKLKNKEFLELWSDSFFEKNFISNDKYKKNNFLIGSLYTTAGYFFGLKNDINSLKSGFFLSEKGLDFLENAKLLAENPKEFQKVKKNYQTAFQVYSAIVLKLCISSFPESISIGDNISKILQKQKSILLSQYLILSKKQKNSKDQNSQKCIISNMQKVSNELYEIESIIKKLEEIKKTLKKEYFKIIQDPSICLQKQNIALNGESFQNISKVLQQEIENIKDLNKDLRNIYQDDFYKLCEEENSSGKSLNFNILGEFDYFGENSYIIADKIGKQQSFPKIDKQKYQKITTMKQKVGIMKGLPIYTIWTENKGFLQPDSQSVKFFDTESHQINTQKTPIIKRDKKSGGFVFSDNISKSVAYTTFDLRSSDFHQKNIGFDDFSKKNDNILTGWSKGLNKAIKKTSDFMFSGSESEKYIAIQYLEKYFKGKYKYAPTNFKEFSDLSFDNKITKKTNLENIDYLKQQEQTKVLYCETANKIFSKILNGLGIKNKYTLGFYTKDGLVRDPGHAFVQIFVNGKRTIFDATPLTPYNEKVKKFMSSQSQKKEQNFSQKTIKDAKQKLKNKSSNTKQSLQNILNSMNKMTKQKPKKGNGKSGENIKNVLENLSNEKKDFIKKLKKNGDEWYKNIQQKEKSTNYSSQKDVEEIFSEFDGYFQDYIQKTKSKQKIPRK